MFTVAAATPKDIDAIADLLDELDRFYGDPGDEPRDHRNRQIRSALFGDIPAAYALLARDGANLVGFAAYSFLWPAAGSTRSLYLKEMYVAETHRKRGIGKLLMGALFETATKHECSRVEWTTDSGNQGARQFYEELGLQRQDSKIFYRADTQRIDQGFQ